MRWLCHKVYYFLASEKGVEFAMKCKDAAEQVDLGISKSKIGRFRFYLHISLCQACHNYAKTSSVLKAAVKSVLVQGQNQERIDNLNKELLAKYKGQNASK